MLQNKRKSLSTLFVVGRRVVGTLGVMGVLGILAVGGVSCTRTESPFKIGYIGSLSGKFADLGATARDGALLAIEEFNQKRGINGRTIEMVILDDGGDPQVATALAEEASAAGLKFIVGPFTTASGTAVLPVINREKILTISGSTMGDNLENQVDYYIKLNPSTKAFGVELSKYTRQEGLKRLSAVSDRKNDPYCKTVMDGFVPGFDEGEARFIKEISFNSNDKVSYSGIARELGSLETDGVLICASSLDTANLAQHIKRELSEVNLFTIPWAVSKGLQERGGSSVLGMKFFMPMTYEDKSQNYLEFAERYRGRFGADPSFVALFNFEAVTILVEALREKPGGTPLEIRDLITGKDKHEGVQEDFFIDAEGDVVRPMILHEITDEGFKRLD